MQQGLGLYYYVVFKTSAPDGSAFFGITRTQNPTYGADSEPITYYGNGPKLAAKAKQYGGLHRLTYSVLQVHGDYDSAKRQLDGILNDATLADPRCLNMPRPPSGPEHGAKVSAALTDLPKSESHKLAISEAMLGNNNAIGHVVTEEHKEKISEANTTKFKWWHKKETGEELQLSADEEGLTGFELGRLPKEYKKNFKRDRKIEMSDADRAKFVRD